MEKDKCVIVKEKNVNSSGWKPVTVSVEVYDQVRAICDEAGLPMSKVAGILIEFALERVMLK